METYLKSLRVAQSDVLGVQQNFEKPNTCEGWMQYYNIQGLLLRTVQSQRHIEGARVAATLNVISRTATWGVTNGEESSMHKSVGI